MACVVFGSLSLRCGALFVWISSCLLLAVPGPVLAPVGKPPAVVPAFFPARCCVRGNVQARLHEFFQLVPSTRFGPCLIACVWSFT